MAESRESVAWLTALEMRVLVLMREGLATEEIAQRLGQSHEAIRDHVAEVRHKLELIRRNHLASRVQRVDSQGGEGEPSGSYSSQRE